MPVFPEDRIPLDMREVTKKVWTAMRGMEGVEPVGIGPTTKILVGSLARVCITYRYATEDYGDMHTLPFFSGDSEAEILSHLHESLAAFQVSHVERCLAILERYGALEEEIRAILDASD